MPTQVHIAENHAAEPMYQPAPAVVRTPVQRQPTRIERALELLRQNPEWVKRTARDLEGATGINKNVWPDAKKAYAKELGI